MMQSGGLSPETMLDALRMMFTQRWIVAAMCVVTVGLSIDISTGVLSTLRKVQKETGFNSIFEWSAVVVIALRQYGETDDIRYPLLQKIIFLPTVGAIAVCLFSVPYIMYALDMGLVSIFVFFYLGYLVLGFSLLGALMLVLPPVFGLTAYVSTVVRAVGKLV